MNRLLRIIASKNLDAPMWALDHPTHGDLLAARHVIRSLGYEEETIRDVGGFLASMGIDAEDLQPSEPKRSTRRASVNSSMPGLRSLGEE